MTALAISTSATAARLTMVVGTYTGGGSRGVYTYSIDSSTGDAQLLDSVAVDNPSYVAVAPDGKHLYTVGENGVGKSRVNALSLDKATGHMQLLGSVDARGDNPCHITFVAPHTVSVANYTSGSLALFNINPASGILSEATQVFPFSTSSVYQPNQDHSHIHFSQVTPDGKYLLVNNLGGDRIYDSTKVAPGSGPRHLVFSPDDKKVYLMTELSDQVMAFNYYDGHLSHYQTINAAETPAHGGADIHITPGEGRYLYASVRLVGDGIAIFKVDYNGLLKKVGYQKTGRHPRNFIITPDGRLLLCACRDSNVIQVFSIDSTTGLLTDLHKDIKLSRPVCLKFAK